MTFLSSVLSVRTMICPSAVHLPLRHLVFKTNRKKTMSAIFFENIQIVQIQILLLKFLEKHKVVGDKNDKMKMDRCFLIDGKPNGQILMDHGTENKKWFR